MSIIYPTCSQNSKQTHQQFNPGAATPTSDDEVLLQPAPVNTVHVWPHAMCRLDGRHWLVAGSGVPKQHLNHTTAQVFYCDANKVEATGSTEDAALSDSAMPQAGRAATTNSNIV